MDKRLGDNTSHSIARETTVNNRLQQQDNAEGSGLQRLNQCIKPNKIVLHGVPDIAAHGRPADFTRYVSNQLDAPRRGSPSMAPFQCIQAVSHIVRLGSRKRAVLMEFSTHKAKHDHQLPKHTVHIIPASGRQSESVLLAVRQQLPFSITHLDLSRLGPHEGPESFKLSC